MRLRGTANPQLQGSAEQRCCSVPVALLAGGLQHYPDIVVEDAASVPDGCFGSVMVIMFAVESQHDSLAILLYSPYHIDSVTARCE